METLHMIIILVLLTLFIRWVMSPTSEGFWGAITQLQAKGPQDVHLTVNNEKYIDPYGYRYPYDKYVWNNPTRYRRPYYYYDYNYHLFPFFYYWWY